LNVSTAVGCHRKTQEKNISCKRKVKYENNIKEVKKSRNGWQPFIRRVLFQPPLSF
jgi:hypothetical protein